MTDKEKIIERVPEWIPKCDNCKQGQLQVIQIPGGSQYCKICWNEITNKTNMKNLEASNKELKAENTELKEQLNETVNRWVFRDLDSKKEIKMWKARWEKLEKDIDSLTEAFETEMEGAAFNEAVLAVHCLMKELEEKGGSEKPGKKEMI